jgi:hypothetical protein
MISAKQLLSEVINSLRNVIAPAITEPYPKAQAYMAAVILEFVARQVEERADLEEQKRLALNAFFRDLAELPESIRLTDNSLPDELRLCKVIERLYEERAHLAPETFIAANQRIRHVLRQMLDQELKIAKPT